MFNNKFICYDRPKIRFKKINFYIQRVRRPNLKIYNQTSLSYSLCIPQLVKFLTTQNHTRTVEFQKEKHNQILLENIASKMEWHTVHRRYQRFSNAPGIDANRIVPQEEKCIGSDEEFQ